MGWANLPTPAPRTGRRWLATGIAIAIAVVLILALLYVGGFLFRPGSSQGPSSPWQTYSQAEPRAAAAAAGTPGGPWLPVVAAAFAFPGAVSVPATNLTSILQAINCTVTWIGGSAPTVSVPATPSNAGSGHSGFWIVGFRNSAGELLIGTVTQGNATVLLTAGGSTCTSRVSDLVQIPSSVVDSPIAVENASAAGGAKFLDSHANVSQSWVLVGGINVFGIFQSAATWSIEDTTCTVPTSIDQVGATFNATVSGLTGIVIRNATNGTVDCSLTTPTGLTLLAHSVGTVPATKAI
jgi:hypothetical protein